MTNKSTILEKIFLVIIIFTIIVSVFFIWPPNEIKDQEEYFAYLDDEFNGLANIFQFYPRFDNKNREKKPRKPLNILNKEAELEIPKINVRTPIIFNVNAGNKIEYLKALEQGVAHFAGTAYPGDNFGNIFIFGHSSYYRNEPGNFKDIFKDLENLEIDDEIIIADKKSDKKNVYKIYEKKIVEPSYTEAFSQSDDNILTLMTCWPVGTNKKRLLVIAKPIQNL